MIRNGLVTPDSNCTEPAGYDAAKLTATLTFPPALSGDISLPTGRKPTWEGDGTGDG